MNCLKFLALMITFNFTLISCNEIGNLDYGIDSNEMLSAKNGGILNNRSIIKYPLLAEKGQFYSKIFFSEKKKYNYLLLINTTDSTIYFDCYDGQIEMVQEASNPNNEWQPIEYILPRTCTMGYGYSKIEPQEILYYKINQYTGNYLTKLRVKYKLNDQIYYSNSFYSKINLGQFIKPINIRRLKFLEKN